MSEERPLIYYILGRVVMAVPLILAIIVLNFLLIHFVPGDPVAIFIGDFEVSEEYYNMIKTKMGLDKPVYVQLLIYIGNILRGDLGTSFMTFEPVSKLILERMGYTLILVALSMVWASILGIILGTLAARKPFSLIDNVASIIAVIGYSLPYFWLGMMVIIIFALRLDIAPIGGLQTLGIEFTQLEYILDRLHHLALPTFTMGIWQLAITTRLTRASLHDVLGQDYIIMAWSKGLREKDILLKHGLRNAILPVITIIGMRVGTAFGGAVLTETVFSYPGVGRLMYLALIQRDYPVMLGILLVISFTVILANLLVDILYIFIDPRVKYT